MRGSIGRAAQAEGISQPAASKRLALLERQLGVHLVDRTAAGSTLTAEGRVVVDWARRVLATVDQLWEVVGSLRHRTSSDLNLAASMTIAEHLVPRWLLELRVTHPDLHVGLRVANSEHVQELVVAGDADLGFVEGPSVDRRLRTRQVDVDRLAVVVVPDHPWVRRRVGVRRAELLSTPLVTREPGSGTRLTLDRMLDPENPAKPLLELGSNEAVKAAVVAGAGAAVLSVLAVADDLATGRLVEVRVQDLDLHRRLRAVWRRGHPLSEPSTWLLRVAAPADNRWKD